MGQRHSRFTTRGTRLSSDDPALNKKPAICREFEKGRADLKGIEFEVGWWDQDVIEYLVRCSNGAFAGEVKMYTGHDELSNAANLLCGFPSFNNDSREVELGTFQPNLAGGGIRMHFDCVDSVGHACVQIKLRANGCKVMGDAQSVCLLVPAEAGAIDAFVAQIQCTKITNGAKVSLQMADHAAGWVKEWLSG